MNRITTACLDMAGTTVADDGSVLAAFGAAMEQFGLAPGAPGYDEAAGVVHETMGQSKIEVFRRVLGQEAAAQMQMAGDEPDVVIGCVGGGSNFAGLAFPFVRRVLRGEATMRFLAAEPSACPTLTRGAYRYDFGDTAGLTPLMPMFTLGHDFVPPPVHAGGLRYHGDAPVICGLVKAGLIEARAYRQNETFAAAVVPVVPPEVVVDAPSFSVLDCPPHPPRAAAAAALTLIPVCVPAIKLFAVSVTVSDWVPAVFSVALNVRVPASAAVKV